MERKKTIIAPEALNLKVEISNELGIHQHNNMTRSEYPVYTNNKNQVAKYYNHDLLY